jgi:hypothetical protein
LSCTSTSSFLFPPALHATTACGPTRAQPPPRCRRRPGTSACRQSCTVLSNDRCPSLASLPCISKFWRLPSYFPRRYPRPAKLFHRCHLGSQPAVASSLLTERRLLLTPNCRRGVKTSARVRTDEWGSRACLSFKTLLLGKSKNFFDKVVLKATTLNSHLKLHQNHYSYSYRLLRAAADDVDTRATSCDRQTL